MIQRYLIIAAVLAVVAFAFWRPARAPVIDASVAPAVPERAAAAARPQRRSLRGGIAADDLVVYVAGAVKRPGLYRLRPSDRDAQAIERAGGFSAAADSGGINLAQRASDGDEVYVPAAGESAPRSHSSHRSSRRHRASPPPGSVDVNAADAVQLAAVPGIGRAIAQRIVELRRREGDFASLDELLDVAGMTSSRLDRARPYLREP